MKNKRIDFCKKIIKAIFILQTVLTGGLCFALDADTYSKFMEQYKNNEGDGQINLQTDIVMDENFGAPGRSSIQINGNNNTIDGNNYSGIELKNNQSLNLEAVKMKNFHSSSGGGIYNNNNGYIQNLNGVFTNNKSDADGGVIFNSSKIDNISAEFLYNRAGINGGAIYNHLESVIENINAKFIGNTAESNSGGAIFNIGRIGMIEGLFEENSTEIDGGGAITNFDQIDKIKGDFINNRAESFGGAIYNMGTINYIDGNFIGNTAKKDTYSDGGGGAIYNIYGTIERISGNFENNVSDGRGGAIYNAYGQINFVSDENNTTFSNNTDTTGNNAIFNDEGTINFNAGDFDIVINDAIDGAGKENSVININKNFDTFPTGGKMYLNNSVANNTVNMYDGTLVLGSTVQNGIEYGANFTSTTDFNYYGGTIDTRDSITSNTNLGNLTLYNNMDLKIDGHCSSHNSDTISANSFNSNNYNIDICNINIIEPSTEKEFELCPIGNDCGDEVKQSLARAMEYTGEEIIETPIYKYKTHYDDSRGMLIFERIDTPAIEPDERPKDEYEIYNPAVFSAPVAAQIGGYLNQINSYNEAFANMDMYMLIPKNLRKTIDFQNLYASVSNTKYTNPSISLLENKYNWVRPYTIFEKVALKSGPKVSNTSWGIFFGQETPITKTINKKFNTIISPYIGYNGSHQTYDNVGIYQNGGTIGAVIFSYIENFFIGMTANVGANGCQAQTMYGQDNFAMLMTGAAIKGGYNKEFNDGKFIIQPSLLLSYTFVDTYNYTESSGVKINSKPLNAIQIAPEIKLAANLKNGWQPYIKASMIWNIIDKTNFKANEVSLPQLSVKPFILYGIGVRKLWGERFSGFAQIFVRNGGRNGVGLSFGFRWRI